jgi:AcrR family transcriptional regulator
VRAAPAVASGPAAASDQPEPRPYSAAQTRVIQAALNLFGEHGVAGTSLQMIADAVGVTKAAVYHQFRTKEEIVVAAVDVELAPVEAALDAAERFEHEPRVAEVVLAQVIENAVARRRIVSTLQHDPVVARLLAEHERFQRFMKRLYRLLVGDDISAAARVRAAMISAALGGAVTHPFVAGLDDETLRSELLRQARSLLRPTD